MTTVMAPIEFPRYPASYRSGTGAMAVFLLAGVAAGTGGSFNLQNIAQVRDLQSQPIFEIRGHQEKRMKVRSIAQHLESIRDSFGLRMSEIAEILGVSRPAVYASLAGAEPRQEVSARIWRLSKSADEVRDLGPGQLGRYLRYPVAGGSSVLDLLRSGQDIREALLAVREIPAEESHRRELLAKARGGPANGSSVLTRYRVMG